MGGVKKNVAGLVDEAAHQRRAAGRFTTQRCKTRPRAMLPRFGAATGVALRSLARACAAVVTRRKRSSAAVTALWSAKTSGLEGASPKFWQSSSKRCLSVRPTSTALAFLWAMATAPPAPLVRA